MSLLGRKGYVIVEGKQETSNVLKLVGRSKDVICIKLYIIYIIYVWKDNS